LLAKAIDNEDSELYEPFQSKMNGGVNMIKYLVLVIYDISNDKRRLRVSKYLKGFGLGFKNSAFECNISLSRIMSWQ